MAVTKQQAIHFVCSWHVQRHSWGGCGFFFLNLIMFYGVHIAERIAGCACSPEATEVRHSPLWNSSQPIQRKCFCIWGDYLSHEYCLSRQLNHLIPIYLIDWGPTGLYNRSPPFCPLHKMTLPKLVCKCSPMNDMVRMGKLGSMCLLSKALDYLALIRQR